MLVLFAAIVDASGVGRVTASRINAADISICINRIHHPLVLTISTNGPQANFRSQGR